MAADEDPAKDAPAGEGGAGDAKAGGERRAGQRQRPPVTIDLPAGEVQARATTAEPPAAAKPAPETTAEPARTSGERRSTEPGRSTQSFRGATRGLAPDDGWQRGLVAGVAGGLVALILVLLLQAVGILPAPGRSAANQAIDQAKSAADTATALDRRVTAIEAMTEGLQAMRTDLHALSDRVAALEAARGSLAARSDLDTLASAVAALRQQASVAPAVTADDLKTLNDRIARLELATTTPAGDNTGGTSAAITSLQAELADSDAKIGALSDRVAAADARMAAAVAPAAGEAAIRAMALSSLRQAAAAGQPFSVDVDRVAALGAAGNDVATLRPLAEKGVEDKAALVAEFPSVADAILAATTANDTDAGFFQRVLNGVTHLVTIRPVGPIAGTDPAAIVSRMSDAAAKGDLATVLAERDGLPQAGKDASAAWAAKARDRTALDALIERVAQSLDPAKAG